MHFAQPLKTILGLKWLSNHFLCSPQSFWERLVLIIWYISIANHISSFCWMMIFSISINITFKAKWSPDYFCRLLFCANHHAEMPHLTTAFDKWQSINSDHKVEISVFLEKHTSLALMPLMTHVMATQHDEQCWQSASALWHGQNFFNNSSSPGPNKPVYLIFICLWVQYWCSVISTSLFVVTALMYCCVMKGFMLFLVVFMGHTSPADKTGLLMSWIEPRNLVRFPFIGRRLWFIAVFTRLYRFVKEGDCALCAGEASL